MAADPRIETPEPEVGSGAAAPSEAAGNRAASDGTAAPEPPKPRVPAGEPEAPVGPVTTPTEEKQEPEAPEKDEEPVDVAALQARAAKADEYLELAQRTKAEFDNFRKRSAREAAAAQERGASKLALELLPAIDNLDRALAHAASTEDGNGDASLIHGIKHVHADVLAALRRAGIEPYDPAGEQFDPQFHEAVAQQPQEGAEPGTVLEVYQRGYRKGESILRPARVVVAG